MSVVCVNRPEWPGLEYCKTNIKRAAQTGWASVSCASRTPGSTDSGQGAEFGPLTPLPSHSQAPPGPEGISGGISFRLVPGTSCRPLRPELASLSDPPLPGALSVAPPTQVLRCGDLGGTK